MDVRTSRKRDDKNSEWIKQKNKTGSCAKPLSTPP